MVDRARTTTAEYLRASEESKEGDGGACVNCGYSDEIQSHHILMVAAGGSDDADNLVTLCNECHQEVHRRGRVLEKEVLPVELIDDYDPAESPRFSGFRTKDVSKLRPSERLILKFMRERSEIVSRKQIAIETGLAPETVSSGLLFLQTAGQVGRFGQGMYRYLTEKECEQYSREWVSSELEREGV